MNSFKARTPWAAAVIGLFLGPIIGMLYLSKGRIAFQYFIIFLFLIASLFIAAHYDILHFNPLITMKILFALIILIGALHCYSIAKKGVGELKWYARWYNIILVFYILPYALAFGFRSFLYEPFHISSGSMSPTITAGDYFFVNKYDSQLPARGDVVVFRNPQKPSQKYIKRIIGMPGERVQLKEGVVYINDLPLPRRQIENYENNGKSIPRFIEILPGGKEIMILKTKGIVDDTAVFEVPLENYFVLGDNRDNSFDSRFLNNFGYVPEQNIIGKPDCILWNSETYKFSCKPVD